MPERHADASAYGGDSLDGYRQGEHQYREQPGQSFQHRQGVYRNPRDAVPTEHPVSVPVLMNTKPNSNRPKEQRDACYARTV